MKKFVLILILILNTGALTTSIYIGYSHLFLKNDSVAEYESQPVKIVNNEKEYVEKVNPAQINMSSIPQEAKVFVNGYYKGRTPVEFKVVDLVGTGTFRLVLIKQGYARWEKQIELNSGEFKEYKIILEKEKSEIR